jgi:hypothetical protein
LNEERKACLGTLTEGGLNWHVALHLAHEHGLMPLLFSQLRTMDHAKVPSRALAILRERYFYPGVRNSTLSTELCALTAAFDAAGISMVSFKGSLLTGYYGSVTLCESSNFIVRREKCSA